LVAVGDSWQSCGASEANAASPDKDTPIGASLFRIGKKTEKTEQHHRPMFDRMLYQIWFLLIPAEKPAARQEVGRISGFSADFSSVASG
jgi:hypothetical protein